MITSASCSGHHVSIPRHGWKTSIQNHAYIDFWVWISPLSTSKFILNVYKHIRVKELCRCIWYNYIQICSEFSYSTESVICGSDIGWPSAARRFIALSTDMIRCGSGKDWAITEIIIIWGRPTNTIKPKFQQHEKVEPTHTPTDGVCLFTWCGNVLFTMFMTWLLQMAGHIRHSFSHTYRILVRRHKNFKGFLLIRVGAIKRQWYIMIVLPNSIEWIQFEWNQRRNYLRKFIIN